MFGQIDPQSAYYIVGIAASIGTGILTVAAVFYKIGKLEGTLTSTVTSMRSWLADLADGKGPICSEHKRQLFDHERRLGEHDEKIEHLEDEAKYWQRGKTAGDAR
jgi:hypothetical protein